MFNAEIFLQENKNNAICCKIAKDDEIKKVDEKAASSTKKQKEHLLTELSCK